MKKPNAHVVIFVNYSDVDHREFPMNPAVFVDDIGGDSKRAKLIRAIAPLRKAGTTRAEVDRALRGLIPDNMLKVILADGTKRKAKEEGFGSLVSLNCFSFYEPHEPHQNGSIDTPEQWASIKGSMSTTQH